jgi:RNA polymerase sigma factor (sigma-70 family)
MASYPSTINELSRYCNFISNKNRTRLTHEQELEEYKKAKSANEEDRKEAMQRIIGSNIGLLKNMLIKFDYSASKAGISLDDLAGEVIMQIVGSTFDKFNPELHKSVGEYLFREDFWRPKIRGMIHTYSKQGIKYVPMYKKIHYLPLPKEGNDEMDEAHTTPEERASFTEISKLLREVPTSADETMHKVDYEHLQKVVSKLEPIEREIVRGMYFEEKSSEELGQKRGITGSRIRQIRDIALKRLKTRRRKIA